VSEFLKNLTCENILEPPLNHPSMEDALFYDPLSNEEDDFYQFVEFLGVGNWTEFCSCDQETREKNPKESTNTRQT